MSTTTTFEVIVIGAGPAGENATGRCADGGLSVAIIERELVGGECSYWGCMPSKVTTYEAARAVVIATGTSAVIPPIPGLRDTAPWDNRTGTATKEIPRRLLVLGGRAIGAEMAQAVQRDAPDGPVTATLADGRKLVADEILVAVGRQPATGDLGLETVGLEPGTPVAVDDQLRATGVAGDWLYAVGDGIAGTARIVVDEDRRVIVGATFTGPGTAELLHSATVAIVGEVTLDRLWHAVPSFPTLSEVWLRLLEAYGL